MPAAGVVAGGLPEGYDTALASGATFGDALLAPTVLYTPLVAALLTAGTPVPTPWNKEKFDQFERGIQRERKELRAAGKPEAAADNRPAVAGNRLACMPRVAARETGPVVPRSQAR